MEQKLPKVPKDIRLPKKPKDDDAVRSEVEKWTSSPGLRSPK
jgi:hypothetical protein